MSTTFDPMALLNFIGSHEAPNGYDDYYRKASFPPPKPLTQMTINEVREWQAAANPPGGGTAAAGRYQIVNYKGGETLDWLVGQLGLTGDELFDQQTQDKMGLRLLERRGLSKFQRGEITAAQFGNNVAKEWAGMPMLEGPKRGKSYYGGDGTNRALTSAEKFEALFGGTSAVTLTGSEGATPASEDVSSPKPEALPFAVTDIAPAEGTLSETDTNAAFEAAEDEAPGILEGTGMAIEQEWVGAWAMKQIGRESFAPDDNFTFSEELWDELTEGLPEDYVEGLFGAVSEDHARYLAENLRSSLETEKKLGMMGGIGAALRIGVSVADPVAIGAAILTDGIIAGPAAAAKATRAERALRLGLSAGASNAAVEGYIASQAPGRTSEDVIIAGMTGLALGGGLGYAFSRSDTDTALATVARDFLTEAPDGNIGAARAVADTGEAVSAAEAQLANAVDAPRSAFGKARIDMVGNLKSSNHPIIRKLAGALAEDGVGNADHSVLTRAASENVTFATKRDMARFHRKANPAFREWLRENGVPFWKAVTKREEFMTEVGRAVRREAGTYSSSKAVNDVADELRNLHRDLLRFAKDKGVKGFEEIPESATYLTRVHNIQKIDEMVTRFGEHNVNRLVQNALISGGSELDPEDLDKIATAYLKSIRQRRYGDVDTARVLDGEQREVLEAMLLETDLAAEEVARISRLVARDDDAGRIGNAKRRLRLDETYSEIIRDGSGNSMRISIEDMLNNNAEELITRYARQISGAGYLNDALRQFAIPHADGLAESVPTVDTVISHIRQTAHKYGMTRAELDEAVEKLELLAKAVRGIPLNKTSRAGEALRLIRDYNFIRVMNQVGFAQIVEIGNIVGEAGWKATLQHVPALRSIWSRAKDGKMSDDLLDEIEVIWGIGTDRLRRSFTNRYDDYGVFEGGSVGKIDNVLQHGKAITADISLMSGVNSALQRMTARATIQRVMNMATGKGRISDKRLASLGLTPAMSRRVLAQMRDHVDEQPGIFGRRIRRINIDEWDDQEAASAFINTIDRWSRRVIQENDIGQMSKWMTTDLGKSLIQFRSFMIAAWQKQTLRGLHHRDWDTFQAWATSTFFAGLSYTAQTHINAFGRDDADEFLAERLNAVELGKASFQRGGYASIIPATVDMFAFFPGYEPVFAYGRTTGMASNILTGNPTVDLGDKLFKAGRGVIAPATSDDYAFSQQDARAMTGALAFQNAMGVKNILEMMRSTLPKYSN